MYHDILQFFRFSLLMLNRIRLLFMKFCSISCCCIIDRKNNIFISLTYEENDFQCCHFIIILLFLIYIIGVFGDNIREMSWAVGEVMSEIKRLGFDDNTLVLFTSDNGGHTELCKEGGDNGVFRGE